MQKLYPTRFIRYNVLKDNEFYYVIDLFSNRRTLLLPFVSAWMKRKAYRIEEKDIPNGFLNKPNRKLILPMAIISSIVIICNQILARVMKLAYLDISRSKVIIVEFIIVTFLIASFMFLMIWERTQMSKIVLIKQFPVYFIRDRRIQKEKRKSFRASILILIMFWSFIFVFFYGNMINSNAMLFIGIAFCVFMLLYFSLPIPIICGDDDYIITKID